MFALFNFIIAMVLYLIQSLLDIPAVLSGLYSLFIILPSLAVAIRRLHDTDKSGWWVLISLVPLVGFIIFLVFMCLDGEEKPNRFGPNPKGDASASNVG